MPYKDPEKRRECQRRYDLRRRKFPPVSLARNRASLGYCKPSLAPTERPSNYDIAWAAGIYEGEGNCKWTSCLNICVGQNDLWLLERLRTLFGGSVSSKVNKSGCWFWRLTGARARGFAYTIFSFLSPKRRSQLKQVFTLDKLRTAVPRY